MFPELDDDDEFDAALNEWLAGLDAAELAVVLARRPDALAAPWPRRLADLVWRLSDEESVVLALRRLSTPVSQVLDAIQLTWALGDGRPALVAEVAGWLGASVADIRPALDELAAHALAWIDSRGRVMLARVVQGGGYAKRGLGDPLAEILPAHTADQLRGVATALGLTTPGRKSELAARLLDFFRDGERVRAVLTTAPPSAAALLDRLAWDGPDGEVGPELAVRLTAGGRPGPADGPVSWAVRRGLLWPSGFDGVHLPLEVGLALRGSDYRLPFTPVAPALPTAAVAPAQVLAESAAAALRLLDRTAAAVTATGDSPLPLLKAGRVGVQAVKALAKRIGSGVEETRLAVELAIRLLLLAPVEPEPEPGPRTGGNRGRRASRKPVPAPAVGLAPSERFAAWRALDSATRLAGLVDAWWSLPLSPLADEKAVRALLDDEPSDGFVHVRQLAVRLLAALPEGAGLAEDGSVGSGLAELVGWHAPTLSPELTGVLAKAVVAEATLLGVVAAGAASPLAHALVAATAEDGIDVAVADDPAVRDAIGALLADAHTTALFGADLTAVVTGPPDTELAALLDLAADRETQGAASTWRFGPGSVRRALDRGETPEGLVARLRAVAQRDLPQPLTYLIGDVGRRHGEVGVFAAGCVLVGESPGLLAEIAAHRKLATLGSRAVAPTVLVCVAPVAETLAALRAAGYAPVERAADGSPVVRVERATPAREPAGQPPVVLDDDDDDVVVVSARGGSDAPPDPRAHAERLLATAGATAPRRQHGELARAVLGRGRDRDVRDPRVLQLMWQLDGGLPARVSYAAPGEAPRDLVISDPELVGEGVVDVWVEPDGRYERLAVGGLRPPGRRSVDRG